MSQSPPNHEELVSRIRKHWRAALFGAILCAVTGWFLMSPFGEKLVHWSYDLPFGLRGPVYPTEAVLVYMDEPSHVELKQPYDRPWDRSLHAELLNRLTAEHPAGVVFDVVFTGPGVSPEADQKLADAIKKNGKVVLAADYRAGGYGDDQSSQGVQAFDLPYDPFYYAAEQRCGSDAVYPDDDVMMRMYRLAETNDDRVPSEAWAAAALIHAPVTQSTATKFQDFYLNYYGPSATIPSVSFYKVLASDSGLPTNFFTGKMVFVGARVFTRYTGDRKDAYPTPFSYWDKANQFTCGVEIEATAFLNLIRNERLQRLSAPVEYAVIILTGLLTGFGLILLRPVAASITAVALAFAVGAVNYWMFTHLHLWFAWVIIVLAQIPIAWIFSISVNSVQLYVEKQLVEHSLSLYLSPKLVKKFARNPKLLKPGAEKQMLTILFSDIAGFTTISEGMDSDELARLMNVYFQSAVQNCIHATDGTVVKYIGDAIFAFWNAPDLQSDHSFRACEAALHFRNQDVQHINGRELITRIGLHTGVANVGNFGSDTRIDYTAIGENINLAARMEGLNKYLGTRVLLTAETQAGAGPRLVTRYLGLFRLKGFEKAVGVYELTGWRADEAATQELRACFAMALEKLAARDFDGAEAAFRQTLEIAPHDGPSEFYLEQIEELRVTTLTCGWKGEITLKEK
jgi:adenylate cyclase